MANTVTPLWFTPPQVARQFGVSLPTVRGWISSGALKAINAAATGRQPRHRIHVEDIRAFEASRIVRPADETVRPADEGLTRLLDQLNELLVAYELIAQRPDDDIASRLPSEEAVVSACSELLSKGMKHESMQVQGRFAFLRSDALHARHGEPYKLKALKRAEQSAEYLRGLIRDLG